MKETSLKVEVLESDHNDHFSVYDILGIKFGSKRLPLEREFEIEMPVRYNHIELEHSDYYDKKPLLIYNYENDGRSQPVKFIWAGETETIDPKRIIKYLGFCRIQGNIQHLLIVN